MIKLSPSVLSADFLHLEDSIRRMEDAGADMLHFDVMDGHFVPNLSFGMPILEAMHKGTKLPLDVHLMIDNPEQYIERFAAAGADIITVHAEATRHLHRLIQQIHAAGCKAGVSLNPATTPDCLKYVINDVDLVLAMSVNPGFGGQKMIPAVVDKVREIRDMFNAAGRPEVMVEVDGGVNTVTGVDFIRAGADVLVAGSALFGAKDAKAFIDTLKAAE